MRQTCERILAAHLLNKAPLSSLSGITSSGGTHHCTSRGGYKIAEGHGVSVLHNTVGYATSINEAHKKDWRDLDLMPAWK